MLNLVYLMFMADPREVIFFFITCLLDLGCLSRFKLFSGGADTPARIKGDSYKNGGEVNSTWLLLWRRFVFLWLQLVEACS
uniref:Uncharacterized protein n=1 Tax=Brassica campestris TaxID=3711 RepID=M4FB30_BRACM|nr:unnamed protein product [Brassica rapa]